MSAYIVLSTVIIIALVAVAVIVARSSQPLTSTITAEERDAVEHKHTAWLESTQARHDAWLAQCEHTAWLNEQEAKHDAWVLRAARPLDIEEKEAEYYAHQRKEKAKLAHAIVRLDEYGQECDDNGTPYWILK